MRSISLWVIIVAFDLAAHFSAKSPDCVLLKARIAAGREIGPEAPRVCNA
jgi:hypothetical protein